MSDTKNNRLERLPKITVITPSYNQGAYIEETILSVLNQNYPNLEYIIIDGGSSDNSLDIIKKYETKITRWISEKDSGQSNAINKGIKLATGDIINWLNSDDQLESDALFDIANLYLSNPDCNLFVGQTEFFSSEKKYGRGGKILFPTREITFAHGTLNQPAMFYKTETVKKLGLLNETLHYCMDAEWWLKYLLYFDISTIAVSDNVWAKFRFHDTSKTISNPTEFKKEKSEIYNRIFSHYKVTENKNNIKENYQFPEATTLNLNAALNYYYLWRSDELSLEKQPKKAFKFWLKVNPFTLHISEKRRYIAVLKNIILLQIGFNKKNV